MKDKYIIRILKSMKSLEKNVLQKIFTNILVNMPTD